MRSVKRAGEGVVDGRLDDEALGRDAALSVVLRARLDGGLGGPVEVGVGEDEEGIGAAEFEHGRLERVPGGGADGAPGPVGAGDGGGGDPVVGDEAGDRVVGRRGARRARPRRARPPARIRPARARSLSTFSACLSRPTLPATSAGARKRTACQNGKFHGITASTTPSGSYTTYARAPSTSAGSGPSIAGPCAA